MHVPRLPDGTHGVIPGNLGRDVGMLSHSMSFLLGQGLVKEARRNDFAYRELRQTVLVHIRLRSSVTVVNMIESEDLEMTYVALVDVCKGAVEVYARPVVKKAADHECTVRHSQIGLSAIG